MIGTGLCGVVATALFIRLELRRPDDPLLKIQLLGDRLFRATNVAVACSTASFLGVLHITPIFLQEALHQTALESGPTTFVEAVGVVFSTQSLGRLYSRAGPRRMSAFGLVVLTAIILAMTLVNPGRNLWVVRALMFCAGFANSTAFLPLQTSMFTGIASEETGHASAIFNTQRQTALAIGVALLSTVVAGVHGSVVGSFHTAYVVASLVSATGVIACITLVHDSDAAATMVRTGSAREIVSD